MSQETVEVVRRAIDAFNQRDVDEMVRDCGFRDRGRLVAVPRTHAGIYRGQEAVLGLWETYFEMFDRVTISPDEFIECGEHVVVPNRTHLRGRDHVKVEARSALVVTVRNGRIVKWRLYQERAEALQAVGLSEQNAHADS